MSSQKTTQRRLSLLAGSSLVAASLTVFGGVALAPTAAVAQAVCTSPAAPAGNGTTAVTIAAGTYNPGITCTYTGTASTVSTAGAVTVSTTAGGDGVNLSATGTSAINWNSTAGTVTAGAQTNGPLIDAASATGAINITTGALTANTAGTTHAIRATATGNGAITISRVGTGAVSSTAVGGIAAIEATTSGGAINITTTGSTTGRLRGILAQTSGTGAITLNIGGSVGANATDGVAGIDTVAGTGATNITIASGTVSGGNTGAAIRSVSASTSAATAVNVQNTGGTVNGPVDFSGVTAGGVTFNNTGATSTTGRWTATRASVFGAGNDTLIMSGEGTNTMQSGSSIDFGAGNDTWTLSALLRPTNASVDFGAGTDTFNMIGRLAVNGVFTLDNLEAFNNSGVIYMGGTTGAATDLAASSVLRMTGGTFTGSGDSRVVMDVSPFIAQAGCETLTGGGDCLDLRGASTAGVTLLTLNDIASNDATQGGFDPVGVTLVDVGGAGTSAAGHFILDPETAGYVEDPVFGGAIARPGLFRHVLRYDATNQRHALVGLPRSETLEYAMLSSAAQSIWHMTTETVTDRQSDLRAAPEAGALWMRTTGEYTKRNVATDFSVFDDSLVFDNGYKLYAGTIIGGLDLIQGRSGGLDYVVGAQIGYVGSSFELNASPSTGRMTGATGGIYGSIWNERTFLDATFNLNGLTLDYDSPGLDTKTNTYTTAFGARLEGGMRWTLSEVLFAEPLATVAFVRTGFEEISLVGGEVRPADAQSRRAALGLRVGGDIDGQIVNWSYFVTGRAWNEFDGEARGVVNNPGANLSFVDEFDGGFGEAEAGLSLYNDANTLSGFASTGVKWKDGYSAVNLSLGVRMAW